MAYLDFREAGFATLARRSVPIAAEQVVLAAPESDELGVVEWAVVALAKMDRLSSIRPPSRLLAFLTRIFTTPVNPQLANERLEALRRLAVQLWRRDVPLSVEEEEAFLGNGFSRSALARISDNIAARRRAATQEVFA